MTHKLKVALENFVPLNQQQRESKAAIEIELARLQEELEGARRALGHFQHNRRVRESIEYHGRQSR